ncbi:hypothetical protein FNF29_04577 [Cafeteria roenbergensis]|uniref:Calponin-homology (CH) domain-containing protein n=1 Tax=Cafeteria roenbergensis TaxID=33653 RepID=A0A5A8CEU6_CAFRO|nr:hypothetical protein FNF29_04577 [Cafeteria roenbergensis]|eukprot:KAA0151378.1 hypothetical protein FNF29_04577 [Cafeteria roenbergensis]
MVQGQPARDGHLSVFPPAVEFTGIRQGTEYVATLCLQNADTRVQRVRIVPPTAPGWVVEFAPNTALAPGLEVRCKVRFVYPVGGFDVGPGRPASGGAAGGAVAAAAASRRRKAAAAAGDGAIGVSSNGNVLDRLVVLSGDRTVVIPLRALQPAPDVRFDPHVAFGTVVSGQEHTRTLVLRNAGQAAARWRIDSDSALPLRFEPSEGELPADAHATDTNKDGAVSMAEQAAARVDAPSVTVRAVFRAEQEGVFRALASLLVPGQPPAVIDVAAAVVEHSIELVKPDNKGPLSSVGFGAIFYGKVAEVRALVVNNGPAPASVSTVLSKPGKRRAHGMSESTLSAFGGGSDAATDPADDEDNDDPLEMARRLMMEAVPRQCAIPAFGQQEVTFRFRPVDTARPAPFKTQAARVEARARRRVARGEEPHEAPGQLADGSLGALSSLGAGAGAGAGGGLGKAGDGGEDEGAQRKAGRRSVLVETARRSGKLGLPARGKSRDPEALTLTGGHAAEDITRAAVEARLAGVGGDAEHKMADDLMSTTAAAAAVARRMATGSGAGGADGDDGMDEDDGDEDDADMAAAAAALAAPPLDDAFRAQATISCAETGQRIVVDLLGTAVRPIARLSRRMLYFGDCAVGDRRDVAVTLSNPSDTLDLDFSIANVAQYEVTPRRGRLGPQESRQLVVTFRPSNQGAHRMRMPIQLAGGLAQAELRLEGEALGNLGGTKRAVARGPGAPPEAFTTTRKFVPGDKTLKWRTEERKARHPLPWDDSEQPDDAGLGDALATVSVAQGRKLVATSKEQEHRDGYVAYLREGAARRKRVEGESQLRKTGQLPRWDDFASLGMPDPKAGLTEPDPGLPVASEPLWLAQPLDADGKPVPLANAPMLLRADPKKPIRHKFKPRPTTQAEVVDCAAELSDDVLATIRARPKRLDFGETNVRAKLSQSLAVYNGSPQTVLVEIEPPAGVAALSGISPLAQVIPPGKLAGFDVNLEPTDAGELHEVVTWRVNGHHAMRFRVNAQVLPIELELSESELKFSFEDGSDDVAVHREVAIRNPGQAAGQFQWRLPEGTAFSIEPDHGEVPPNGGEVRAKVTFRPVKGLQPRSFAALLVRGGPASIPPPRLALIGQPHNPDLKLATPSERVLDLGHCAVGMARDLGVGLVNRGKTAAVFRVDRGTLPPGVTVEPPTAELGAGEAMTLMLRVKPQSEGKLSPETHLITLQVRGGDPVTMGLQGEAVMPSVSVVEERLEFGGVAVGGTARRRVTLHNRSVIPAEIVVDLADFPEFTLAAPMGMDPDDAASVAGESVFQAESVGAESAVGEAARRSSGDGASSAPGSVASGIAAGKSDEEKDEDEDEEEGEEAPEAPTRFRLRVAAKAVLPLDLVFSPSREGTHSFPLPFLLAGGSGGNAAGAMAGLQRLVTAEALRPRLRLSTTRVEFGHRVLHAELTRRVPYTMTITLTNTEQEEVSWAADTSLLAGSREGGPPVFSWSPAEGVLAPGETDTVRVQFSPADLRDFGVRVPLYLDGDLERARAAAKLLAAVGAGPSGAAAAAAASSAAAPGDGSAGKPLEPSGLDGLRTPESESLAREAGSAEAAAQAAKLAASAAPSVNPYLHVEMHGVGIHPQLTFDCPELILPPVPLRTPAHGAFTIEGHGFDMLRLKYRVLSDSYPSKVPLRIHFPRGDVLSLARPRLPVHIVFESATPLAFTTIIEFTDGDMNKYRMPITGVTDNSALTVAPYIGAHRGESDFVVAPRMPPVLAPAIRDTRRALAAAGLVKGRAGSGGRKRAGAPAAGGPASASGAGAGGGASERRSGASRSSKSGAKGGGSVVLLDQPPLGEDGEPLPSRMPAQQLAAESEAKQVLRWLNATLFRTPVRRFPEDIVALNGRPVLEMVGSLAGKPVPGRVERLPVNGRMRASALYRQARELLAFLKTHGAFVHHVRAEELLPQRDFIRIRKAINGAGSYGGPSAAPMLPLTSPAEKLRQKRTLRHAFPAISVGAWLTVALQAVRVFVMAPVSLSALVALPGMDGSGDAAVLAAMGRVAAAEAEAAEALERLEDERRRGRHDGDPTDGPEGARIRAGVTQAKRKAFAPDAALSRSNVFSVPELVLARWVAFHHNKALPDLPRRVVDFQRDLRDGVVVAGVLLSHCPFLGEEGWPLHKDQLVLAPASEGDMRANWEAVLAALAQLQLPPPFDPSIFLAEGVRAVASEGAALREVADAQAAAKLAAAREAEAQEARDKDATLLASARGSFRSIPSFRDAAGKQSSPAGGGAAAGKRGAGASQEAADALPPGVPASAARDVTALFDTGGILAHRDALRPSRVLPGEGPLRACLLAVHWLFKSLPGVVPKGCLEFACAVGKESVKAIELRNPASSPIAYSVSLEPLGPPGDADVFAVADSEVVVPAGGEAAFPVTAIARHSRAARARLTFRSRRDGVALATSLVFDLVTKVAARPPASTEVVESRLYEPATATISVTNPFLRPARFAVRLVPMPADAPSGFNVPDVEPVDPMSLAAAQQAAEGHASSDGGTATGAQRDGRGRGGRRGASAGQRGQRRAQQAGPKVRELRVGEWPGEPGEAGPMTGSGRWPAAFWCKAPVVAVKPGATKRLPIQFLPFTLGAHACAVELVDERLGEVVHEIRATALPPAPLATVTFRATMQEEIARDMWVTAPNPRLDRALQSVLQRLDRAGQQAEVAARERRRAAEASRAARAAARVASRETREAMAAFAGGGDAGALAAEDSLASAGSGVDESSLQQATFLVDIDSPWWDVMEDSWRIPDPALPRWAAEAPVKQRRRSVGAAGRAAAAAAAAGGATSAGPLPADAPEGASLAPGAACLEVPEGMRDPGALHLTLRPRAPGTYRSQLVLTSDRETRVYVLEGEVAPSPMRRELELRAPAGDRITQAVPLVNTSRVPWVMHVVLELEDAAAPDGAAAASSAPAGSGGAHKGAKSHHFACNSSITVPPNSKASLPVTFAPARRGRERVRLTVNNTTAPEMPPLVLLVTGVATESAPLAELSIECKARERVESTVTVRNPERHSVTFDVLADLPFVSGKPTVTVPGASRDRPGTAEYAFAVRPMVEGQFSGTLTFSDRAAGAAQQAGEASSQWASLRVGVSAPDPEDVIRVNAMVRDGVAVGVELTNPLDTPAEFEADVRGAGLVGDPLFVLAPGETREYELLFCPLVPGSGQGSLAFSHPTAGELWYEIETEATQPPPTELAPMSTPIGRRERVTVAVENPTRDEASIRAEVDNQRNFTVEPATAVLAPYSRSEVVITYTPSAVGTSEFGVVRITSDRIGEWEFHVQGSGTPPVALADPVLLVAPAGLSASTSVPFRNPFPEPLEVVAEVHLEDGDADTASRPAAAAAAASPAGIRLPAIRGAASAGGSMPSMAGSVAGGAAEGARPAHFELLRRPAAVVPAFSVMQIPLSFAPPTISEYHGELRVRARSKNLTWTFPLRGVAEAPPSKRVLRFRCKARETTGREFELLLPGLRAEPGEEFRVELQAAAQVQDIVRQSVTVEVVDADAVRGPDDPITLHLHMHPPKPFRARTQLVVTKASGGRWRWETHLEADEPDADDTIAIQAELGQRTSVAIALCNSQDSFAPFKAGFSLDSAAEFTVSPPEGMLPPQGAEGETIVVTFSPKEFGKVCHGRLVVETADDQWVYDVVGTQPRYAKPSEAASRIDTKLPSTHMRRMKARAEERAGTNFIRANAAAAARRGRGGPGFRGTAGRG